MENYEAQVIGAVKEHMKTQGISKTELANCLGVSRYRALRILNEQFSLKVSELVAFSEMGVKLPDLPGKAA